MYGSKIFENRTSKDFFSQAPDVFNLIENRKFTQHEFEECCKKVIWLLNDGDKIKFIRASLVANYNIPIVYRDIYPVALMLKYPELTAQLTRKNVGDPNCIARLLMLGYKIQGKDYKGKYIPILNARKIMNNDNYKFIEFY